MYICSSKYRFGARRENNHAKKNLESMKARNQHECFIGIDAATIFISAAPCRELCSWPIACNLCNAQPDIKMQRARCESCSRHRPLHTIALPGRKSWLHLEFAHCSSRCPSHTVPPAAQGSSAATAWRTSTASSTSFSLTYESAVLLSVGCEMSGTFMSTFPGSLAELSNEN